MTVNEEESMGTSMVSPVKIAHPGFYHKPKEIFVILNPVSGAGRTGRKRDEIFSGLRKELGLRITDYVTDEPQDAMDAAKQAIKDGYNFIIGVGGDGTIQEIINGILCAASGHSGCTLGIISSGTGHGFAQSIGLPKSIEDQIAVIRRGRTVRTDVGLVTFVKNDGTKADRYFINECQAGIGGEVVRRVENGRKQMGGFLTFGSVALRTALRYREKEIRVTIDGRTVFNGPLIGLIAANGAYTGGGMNLAPAANISDGYLDVVLIHEQSVGRRLINFSRIYSGNHLRSPKFSAHRGKRIQLFSDDKVPFEADGELLGNLPCTISVVHDAVMIIS
jgi:diacylglycerol kinase (ATP)